jgi:predicted Zn-dependent protease
MRRTFIATIVLIAVSCTSALAQFGSVLDRVKKASDTFTAWSPEQENAIGQASAAKMIHIMGLVEDPALTKYVELVGSTAARQATRPVPYHFAILEAKTPDGHYTVSAFALPGGYVFVTKGALDNMTDEAQLAGVLAHEIAHVDGRHLEKEVQKKKSKAWAVQEGSSHIPGPSELKNIANDVVGQALMSQPSPKDEDDADKKGTQFASGAGYDPTGLKRFLEVLQQKETSGQVTAKDTALWGKSHPPIAQRIAKLSTQTSGASGGQTLPDRFKAAMEAKPATAGSAPATPTQ